MLEAIRKRATGWVAKVLFVLLAISFAVWGVGDMVGARGPSEVVAEVDGLPITAASVRREAELGFEQVQRQVGGGVPREPGIMGSLTQRALEGAVARRLIDAHARELGLSVADATLAERVRAEPGFQGAAGGFDRARFDLFLRSTGTDEAGFFGEMRADEVRADLVAAALAAPAAPATAARLLDAYRGERRRGQALVVDEAGIDVPAPDDATLQAYLDGHADAFRAPELRTVEIVTLEASDLEGEVAVDEAELRQAYEAGTAGRFKTPERRRVAQLLLPDETTARAAAERAAAPGATLEAVAAEFAGRGGAFADLGPVARDGSLPEPVEAAAFGLGAPGLAEPVASPFGWHLVRVDGIEPEMVRPFEAVRAELEREARARAAADRLPDAGTRLDDALAADATLEAAAAEAGGRHRTVTLDRGGIGRDGLTLVEPTPPPATLAEIFEAAPGQTSLLRTDDAGGYYAFAVREVEPSRPQTLEEARAEVLEAWRRERRATAADALARGLLERARAGEAFEALAGAGARVAEIGPVRRDAGPGERALGDAAHAALFATAPGELAPEPLAVPGGQAVLRALEALPADPPPAAGAPGGATRETLRAELSNDLATSYERALRGRYAVTTDAAALRALLPAAAGEGGGGAGAPR